jgi:small subunit ribosomal protein S9
MLINNYDPILKAIGKRKTSIAKVILKRGVGEILVNNIHFDSFFSDTYEEKTKIILPFILTGLKNEYDAIIQVKGGGISSQLEAICLAISKALSLINNSCRTILKKKSLLKRDSRIKERRKYGLKKARKAPQYSKR